MIRIPSLAFVVLAVNAGPALASNLMLDFGAVAAASPYLTTSPGHNAGTVAAGQTSWNTISSSTSSSSLVYGDGSAATGVVLSMGQESTGGSNIINFSTAISNLALEGTGGGTAGQTKLLTTDSIYGINTSSTAAGRDGFFGGGTSTGTGAAIGLSLTGLAAGEYQIYVMARNTNSNASAASMKVYSSVGSASGTFDFNALAATTQSNLVYSTASYTGEYSRFINGENYVALNVTVGAGQTVFLAVEGGDAAIERRGFLNMVQIVQVPEAATTALLGAGCLLLGLRRRR